MDPIFARVRERKLLEQLYLSGKPEFLAVYGRRRVGKTFLIREFFKNKGVYFSLTGRKANSTRNQLNSFVEEYTRVFGLSPDYTPPKNWFEAFSQLRKAIEKLKTTDRIILFLDELPWLATPRSGFLQDLDLFWNRYFSDDPRIILIVCGSAASWMIRKIIRNKGGLYGRLTAQIRLLPFDLKETGAFLQRQGVTLNRKGLVDIYMALGGIPKYLCYIQKGQSAQQIVGQLCFGGPLTDEFDELYASLFDSHQRHVSVIKALAEHSGGLTKSQLAKKTSLAAGGGMNLVLEELEQSGFVITIQEFSKQKKDCRIKLIDEYSLFYLRWGQKAKDSLNLYDENFWMTVFNSAVGQAWAGYAFEVICLKHLSSIKRALGIAGVMTSASSWIYKSPRNSKEVGAQIDLLIDRADNCINLCEIKYCNHEFVIDKAYDKQLRDKKGVFQQQTETKKSLFLTLISPYGVKPNGGYFNTIDVSLSLDDLFV